MSIFLQIAWKYKELILIALVVLYLVYVFKDRASMKVELTELKAEVVRIEQQQSLNEQITKAIQNIKVQSVNYVSAVEASNPPADSSSVVFVDAGVFNPKVFETNVNNNTTPSSKKD